MHIEDEPDTDPVAAAADDPHRIDDASRAAIMDDEMRARLDANADPNAEDAFWAGFQLGVRAYLVEQQIGEVT
jgi:hypothetical protein